MKHRGKITMLAAALALFTAATYPGEGRKDTGQALSLNNDVMPVLRKYCLPCHAEESVNPSELSLDNHTLIMKGGKHGPAVVPGQPDASTLIRKLDEEPPFGDRMPLARRRRSKEPPKRLTEEEVRILAEWIRQGAKNN